jgi:hypothetical protein
MMGHSQILKSCSHRSDEKTQRDSSTAWRRVPRNGTQSKFGRHSAQNERLGIYTRL